MIKNITKTALSLFLTSSILSAASITSVGFDKPDAHANYSYEEINTINMNNSLYLKADMQNIMDFINNTRTQVESLKIEVAELKKTNKKLTEYTNDLQRKIAANSISYTNQVARGVEKQNKLEQKIDIIKAEQKKLSKPSKGTNFATSDKKINMLSKQIANLQKELTAQRIELDRQKNKKVTFVQKDNKQSDTVRINSHILELVK